ncbi:hypothetical protein, partial [Pandoraea nosoerga]|uniref:hypothetical protein n=1 Tax=Pandoraea nosoerga TaxID=2508296 RepID=UPI001C2D713B
MVSRPGVAHDPGRRSAQAFGSPVVAGAFDFFALDGFALAASAAEAGAGAAAALASFVFFDFDAFVGAALAAGPVTGDVAPALALAPVAGVAAGAGAVAPGLAPGVVA